MATQSIPDLRTALEKDLASCGDRIVRLIDGVCWAAKAPPDKLEPIVKLADEIETQLDVLVDSLTVEPPAHDADVLAQADATADDFNNDIAANEYEQFLELLVVSKMRDRMHANKVRKHQGVRAAIRYLENCNVEIPADRETRPASENVGRVWISDDDHGEAAALIERAQTVIDIATDEDAVGGRIEKRLISLLNAALDALGRVETIIDGARLEGDSMRGYRESRCAALGLELFETPDGRQVVLEYHPSTQHVEGNFEAVFIHRDDDDDDLEGWLARRETETAS